MNKKLKISLLGILIAGSVLAITLPIVSCSSSTASETKLIVDESVMKTVVDAITVSFKDKMQENDNRADQVKLAATWKVDEVIPKEELDIIEKELKFKNGNNEVTYKEAVKSIIFTKSAIVGEFGEEIIGPKLKVNLNDGYISDQDITIQVDNLGNVAINNVIPTETSLNDATSAIKKILTDEMAAQPDYDKQVELGIEWSVGSELKADWLNEIKSKLNFVDANGETFSGNDVIKSITFNSETDVPINSGNIVGPKLKISLNDAYISNEDIIIDSGSLGNAIDGTRSLTITSENKTSIQNKLRDAYKARIDGFATFDEQKAYLDDLNTNSSGPGVEIESSIFSQIVPNIKFIDNYGKEVLGRDAIEQIVLIAEFEFSGSKSEVTGGEFYLVMKKGYTYNNGSDSLKIEGVITTLK